MLNPKQSRRPQIQPSLRLRWTIVLTRLLFETTSISLLAVTVYIRQKWYRDNPNQQVIPAICAACVAIAADMLLLIFMAHLHTLSGMGHCLDGLAFILSLAGGVTLYLANYTLINGPYAPAEWDEAENIAIVICGIVVIERLFSFVMSGIWSRAKRKLMTEMEASIGDSEAFGYANKLDSESIEMDVKGCEKRLGQ